MTTIVTQATLAALAAATYEVLSTRYGVTAIILLLLLLLLKEFARRRLAQQAPTTLKVFDIAVFPLLLTFAVVILLRLLGLLNL